MKSPEQLADEVIEVCKLNACTCRATRGCRGTIIGAISEHGAAAYAAGRLEGAEAMRKRVLDALAPMSCACAFKVAGMAEREVK